MIKRYRIDQFFCKWAFALSCIVFFCSRGFSQALPVPDHIVVLIEENYPYSEIIGNPAAPYLNALTTDSNAAVFSGCYALTHPSQPNYLYLFSGSNQGSVDDNIPTGQPFTTPNLAAELTASFKTFVTYAEDLPLVGYNGATFTLGGAKYARKHNPATNWLGFGTNQLSFLVDQPFTSFPVAPNYAILPTVCYVVPNLDHDMHDGAAPSKITQADTWYYTHLDALKQWALTHNTLLIVTFDEDDDSAGNNILTIFYGPMVKGGNYSNYENHVNILGTIEAMYGLGHAGAPFAAGITDSAITYCWKRPPSSIATAQYNEAVFSIAPNPACDVVNFVCNKEISETATVTISDIVGRKMAQHSMNGSKLSVCTANYAAGVYYYRISDSKGKLAEGKFVVEGR